MSISCNRGSGRRPAQQEARRAYGTLPALCLLMAAGPSAEAAPETKTSCEADLTCMRSAPAVKRGVVPVGPNLSEWSLVATTTEPIQAVSNVPRPPLSVRDPQTAMELVLIPGACYRPDADATGQTPTEVCIDPFYIGSHEVTFEAFDQFAEATGRKLPKDEGWGRERRPVINVNVYDALNFAKWLSRRTGEHYRLPTETEWEHAARAGSTTAYPWGDELGSNRANCVGCGSQWDDEQTAPVGSFAPNNWGLYDTVGNVAEWTCSMRIPDRAKSFERCDSIYKTRRRIYRNGSWSDDADRLDSAFRDWNAAMRKTDFVGFRLVRECKACDAIRPQPQQGMLADRKAR